MSLLQIDNSRPLPRPPRCGRLLRAPSVAGCIIEIAHEQDLSLRRAHRVLCEAGVSVQLSTGSEIPMARLSYATIRRWLCRELCVRLNSAEPKRAPARHFHVSSTIPEA